jgi:hypothetical protein
MHREYGKVSHVMTDIALATCTDLPDLDSDNALLLPALAELGLQARPAVWNDPHMDWSVPRVTVVRSTWNYHLARSAFLDWAEQVSRLSDLWNPLELLRWNTHKFYLRDLQQSAIPIIPTCWLEQGTAINLSVMMSRQGWQKAIIKPAVSASAYATLLVTTESIALGQSHLDRFLPTHDMLLQPFVETVTSSHERSLVYIESEFTHAVERRPALNLEPSAQERLIAPQEDELLLSRKILGLLPSPPLYARVDLIHDEAGALRLMELELVEPKLWLSFAPHAVQRFADAIAKRAG